MNRAVAWGDRHQVVLCLAAIAAGVVLGLTAPSTSRGLEAAITPVLGLLLFATFLGVPFARIGRALADARFVAVVLVLNFVVVPVVVFALSRFVAGQAGLLVGVLLVLLTPCVDYVIVFAGLAGGARERLLAVTPLLMLLQMLLLPGFLWLMAGPGVVAAFDPRPFVEAFLLLIVVPLVLATATQLLARRLRFAQGVERVMAAGMVPLVILTLAIVVASQIPAVAGSLASLWIVVPLFLVFAFVLAPVSAVLARLGGLDVAGRRAAVFSSVTRNSLVVLPLALALPGGFDAAPLVVVTQTLVELALMVALVAVVPRVIGPAPGRSRA